MYQLLEKIKARPGMFLGYPSIIKLKSFIDGYNYAGIEDRNEPLINLRNFQTYIEALYEVKRTIGWANILLEDCNDDEAAFFKFFVLYEEFEQQQTVIGQFIDRYVDAVKYDKSTLIWNSLKLSICEGLKTFSVHEGIELIRLKSMCQLLIYDERSNFLREMSGDDAISDLSSMDPWEEKDIYLFDESLRWFIVFTHEDVVLMYEEK